MTAIEAPARRRGPRGKAPGSAPTVEKPYRCTTAGQHAPCWPGRGMHPLHESHCLSETPEASSLHQEHCGDDGTTAPPETAVEIERNLFPLEAPLQARDHGEELLRIVVSVREGQAPPTPVIGLVCDAHHKSDPRGPEYLCLPSAPEIQGP